ncbi:hypothetical protein D3C87_153260 [compost metagenome]|uniref:Uncharacterized protein n=1 Tax=Pedobacter xixiisoli TaxID=1476464 RepID=A0A286A9G0_9SPHI|nr:hypothetical protein [Pedobacter xixiisoli]SOD18548.1 hypothetical protein SAMN06297358_3063 [Pedobacter xixiisoli]
MKRLALLLLCVATLGLASCKKDTYITQELKAKTYNYEIKSTDWKRNADGSFTATWVNKKFDGITLDDEGVMVYFEHPLTTSSFIQLPYTFNYSAYSYELYNGGISFDVQDTNNLTNSVPPNYNVFVKVVVVPSEYEPN